MRLPGYCQRCHKVKTVRATQPVDRGVQVGVCDACKQETRAR